MPDSNQSTPKKLPKEPALECTSTDNSGGATVQHVSEEIAESVMYTLPRLNRNLFFG